RQSESLPVCTLQVASIAIRIVRLLEQRLDAFVQPRTFRDTTEDRRSRPDTHLVDAEARGVRRSEQLDEMRHRAAAAQVRSIDADAHRPDGVQRRARWPRPTRNPMRRTSMFSSP